MFRLDHNQGLCWITGAAMLGGWGILTMRLAVVFLALAVAGCTARGTCEAPPAPSTFALGPPQAGESQADAEARAVRCIHHQAYRLAASRDDGNAVADAVVGACLGQVKHAQAAAYLAATATDTTAAPPPGTILDVPARAADERTPPCANGAATCKPWERQWPAGSAPKVGAVVTEDGRVSNPSDRPSAAHGVGETLAARVAAEARSLAIFRVVEARAGRCRAAPKGG